MKKLLSILAAVGLTATAGAAVVACGTQGDTDKDADFNQNNITKMIEKLSKDEKLVFNVPIGISKEKDDDGNNPLKTELTKQLLVILKENKLTGELEKFSVNTAPDQDQLNKIGTWNSKDYPEVGGHEFIFKIGKEDDEFKVKAEYTINVQDKIESVITEKDLGHLGEKAVSGKEIAKAVSDKFGIKNIDDITVSGKKDGKGKGTANVQVKDYFGKINVSYTYGEKSQPEVPELSTIITVTDLGKLDNTKKDTILNEVVSKNPVAEGKIKIDSVGEKSAVVSALDETEYQGTVEVTFTTKDETPEPDPTFEAHFEKGSVMHVGDKGNKLIVQDDVKDYTATTIENNNIIDLMHNGDEWVINALKEGTAKVVVTANGYQDTVIDIGVKEKELKLSELITETNLGELKDFDKATINAAVLIKNPNAADAGKLEFEINKDNEHDRKGSAIISAEGYVDKIEVNFTLAKYKIETEIVVVEQGKEIQLNIKNPERYVNQNIKLEPALYAQFKIAYVDFVQGKIIIDISNVLDYSPNNKLIIMTDNAETRAVEITNGKIDLTNFTLTLDQTKGTSSNSAIVLAELKKFIGSNEIEWYKDFTTTDLQEIGEGKIVADKSSIWLKGESKINIVLNVNDIKDLKQTWYLKDADIKNPGAISVNDQQEIQKSIRGHVERAFANAGFKNLERGKDYTISGMYDIKAGVNLTDSYFKITVNGNSDFVKGQITFIVRLNEGLSSLK